MNILNTLYGHYSGRCRVMGSDQRVATPSGLHTYPDGLVVCGPMELTRYKGTATLHNPRLLLEVLSASTRAYDLGEKRQQYETIPSLRDILLVEPLEPDVRHVRRTEAGWELRRFRHPDDVVDIDGLQLPLTAIYRDVPEE